MAREMETGSGGDLSRLLGNQEGIPLAGRCVDLGEQFRGGELVKPCLSHHRGHPELGYGVCCLAALVRRPPITKGDSARSQSYCALKL